MSKEVHTEPLAPLQPMSRDAYIEAARRATGACRATAGAWVDRISTPIGRYRKALDAAGLTEVGARSTAGTAGEHRGRPRRGVKAIVVRAGKGEGAGEIAELEGELRARGFCVGDAPAVVVEAKTTP